MDIHGNKKLVDARFLGRLDRKVRRLNNGLSSVYETTQILTSPMDLQQILEMVVKTVAEAVGVDASGLRLLEGEGNELILKATYGLSEAYKNKGPVTSSESELNSRALRGEAIIVGDMRTDPNFKRHHEAVKSEGVISSLSIGLLYRGKGIGILRLYCKRLRRFSDADISLARTVASQSAAAIENARLYREALEGERMSRQLRLAGAVQRHLIPDGSPDIPGIDIAGQYVPCHEVGGDFYDFVEQADGKVLISIGDAMGKGVPASLMMASLRSAIRGMGELVDSIGNLAVRANSLVCHDAEYGEFITLFCAAIEPCCDCHSGGDNKAVARFVYCNCGHEQPIMIRDGKASLLTEGGVILGIDPKAAYDTQTIDLLPGDLIVMYTDGLSEAVNFERESFGRQRIVDAVMSSVDMTAEQAGKNILWLMRKFTGLTNRYDDTALVVIKVPGCDGN